MPSLDRLPERHVDIDNRQDGLYTCFPDVLCTSQGLLLCVYNEFDQHVPSVRRILLRTSHDLGRTWSGLTVLHDSLGHCPRMAEVEPDRIRILDDHAHFESLDNGLTFSPLSRGNRPGSIPDRPMPLGDGRLLTSCHQHVGQVPAAKAGLQAHIHCMAYLSDKKGMTWKPLSVMGQDRCLLLCEASMVRMEDGSILALLRENSFVHEPMYAIKSEDEGRTWSAPFPTPMIGHRPCAGIAPDGRLLVTYRDVSPNKGTSAWMGSLDELRQGFKVHGLHPSPDNPALGPEGLSIRNPAGEGCVRYALRPVTDPETASWELKVELRVNRAGPRGFGVRMGVWWRFQDYGVTPLADPRQEGEEETPLTAPLPLPAGQFHRCRFVCHDGECALFVNGLHRATVPVDHRTVRARPVLVGAMSTLDDNEADVLIRAMSQRIIEPGYGRDYAWEWNHGQGVPDGQAQKRVLQLRASPRAVLPDFGYSGWTTLPDGRFFCAYHHAAGLEEGYEPMRFSYLAGTWFTQGDFQS